MTKRTTGTLLALVALLIAALLVAGTAKTSAAGPRPDLQSYDPIYHGPARPVAVPGQLIVKFKPGLSVAARQGALSALGGSQPEPLLTPNFYLVKLREVSANSVPDAAAFLSRNPDVVSAQPNYYRYSDATPNDPLYVYQWNFPKIQMPSAWDISAGNGVTVAVVDTGIAYENYAQYQLAPDLAGTAFVPGWNFINNSAHANDDNSHGTHVAGTIAQTTNNASGAAGIAYRARLMPLKAINADGSGQDNWVADALVWAADHGAKVINLSLGAESPSLILEDAVNYAYGKGAVIVAAAGNGGSASLLYPAAYPNVIAVGSVRFDETKAGYSNYGNGLSVVAPGGDLSVDQNNDTYPDGILQQTFNPTSRNPTDFGYWLLQGTSMATPHVSGVAALIIAKGAVVTPIQVRQAIQQSAKDLGQAGYDATYGYGEVQARAALDWVVPTPTPTPSPTPIPVSPLTITGVTFSPAFLASGDVLRVDIVVRNDGAGVALTQGPHPGLLYSEGEGADSRGFPDVPGRWRVGVDFGARLGGKDHPYRWGLGSDLAPGATVTVTGYIRLTSQRSTPYWVGLVQEAVRWWQDNTGTTSIAVGPPRAVYGLRFAGATATRYAFVYQCVSNGLLQRVWRVDYGRATAAYQYTRVLPAGASCGNLNPVFQEYQLTIGGGSMTPFGWVTQCTGAGGVRKVWRAGADGRNVPFVYPELSSSCP